MGEIQGKFTVFRPLWRNSYSFPVCFSCSTPLWNGTGGFETELQSLLLNLAMDSGGGKAGFGCIMGALYKKSKPPHRSAPEAYSELFWA